MVLVQLLETEGLNTSYYISTSSQLQISTTNGPSDVHSQRKKIAIVCHGLFLANPNNSDTFLGIITNTSHQGTLIKVMAGIFLYSAQDI